MNVGAIMRTAHAFGASFVFTIDAVYAKREGGRSDTSDAPEHLPLHEYATLDDFRLPRGCALVGIELIEDSVDLPSFRHPRQALPSLSQSQSPFDERRHAAVYHAVRTAESWGHAKSERAGESCWPGRGQTPHPPRPH